MITAWTLICGIYRSASIWRLQQGCFVYTGLLPTLEKFGKTCQLLLGPEDLHFVQSGQDTDGVQITARWAVVCCYLLLLQMLLPGCMTNLHPAGRPL